MQIRYLTTSVALGNYWVNSLPEVEMVEVISVSELLRNATGDGIVMVDLALCGADLSAEERTILCQHSRVVALSSRPNDQEALQWLESGAAGYAHAMSTPDVLQLVLSTIGSGGTWVGRSVLQLLCMRFGRLVSEPGTEGAMAWQDKLTPREIDVVQALRKGLANKEIARQMDISERTVKAHLTSVFQKHGVSDRLQLLLKLGHG